MKRSGGPAGEGYLTGTVASLFSFSSVRPENLFMMKTGGPAPHPVRCRTHLLGTILSAHTWSLHSARRRTLLSPAPPRRTLRCAHLCAL